MDVSPLGSLASSIFDPLSALVGASGGVYALLGGYFMNAVVVSSSAVHQEISFHVTMQYGVGSKET